jgi:hypothetical protein
MRSDPRPDVESLGPLLSLRRRRADANLAAALMAVRSADAHASAQGRALAAADAALADIAAWLAVHLDPRLIETSLSLRAHRLARREAAARGLEAARQAQVGAATALQRAAMDLAALCAKEEALRTADRARRARLADRRDERDREDRTSPGAYG